VKINGAELHVEDTGGAGPAILFSHGLLWSTAMWRFQVEAFLTRFVGAGPFVPAVMKIMFARPFREDPARAGLREGMAREILCNDVTGMRRAVNGVMFRKPLSAEEMARIKAPTLVISGAEDSAVVPERSMRTAARIRGARFLGVPHAGHTAAIEEPQAVNRALREFWDSLPH